MTSTLDSRRRRHLHRASRRGHARDRRDPHRRRPHRRDRRARTRARRAGDRCVRLRGLSRPRLDPPSSVPVRAQGRARRRSTARCCAGCGRCPIPIWHKIDEEALRTAARIGLVELLLSGTTTAADHHYLFAESYRFDPAARDLRGGGGTGHPSGVLPRRRDQGARLRYARPHPDAGRAARHA